MFRGGDIAAGDCHRRGRYGTLTPAHLGVLAGQGYADCAGLQSAHRGRSGHRQRASGPGRSLDARQNLRRQRHPERRPAAAAGLRASGGGTARTTRRRSPVPDEGAAGGMRRRHHQRRRLGGAEGLSARCAGSSWMQTSSSQAWPRSPEAPCWPGTVGGKLVFCLSGNPFAAAATLEQYAIPALLRAAGRCEEGCLLPRTTRTLTTGFSKPSKVDPLPAGQGHGRQRDHPRRGQCRGPFVRQPVGHDGLQLSGGAACGQRPGGPGRRSGGALSLYSEPKQILAEQLELKRPAVLAVSGLHNSGKTTLLEKLLPALRSRGLKVGVIKHDGHDFTPDVPGTDSYRLREAGAEGVAVYSGQRYLLTEAFRLTEQDLAGALRAPRLRPGAAWRASRTAAGRKSKLSAKKFRTHRCLSSRWRWWEIFRVQISASKMRRLWPTGSLPRCRRL